MTAHVPWIVMLMLRDDGNFKLLCDVLAACGYNLADMTYLLACLCRACVARRRHARRRILFSRSWLEGSAYSVLGSMNLTS